MTTVTERVKQECDMLHVVIMNSSNILIKNLNWDIYCFKYQKLSYNFFSDEDTDIMFLIYIQHNNNVYILLRMF